MDEEEELKQTKRWTPKTVAGATMVAVPMTALLTGLGYLAQKAVDLDEKVVMVMEQQKADAQANIELRELAVQVADVETRQNNRGKVIDLVVELDEQVNSGLARLEDLVRQIQNVEQRLNVLEARLYQQVTE